MPSQREHQRILTTYGGVYQDAKLEAVITRVVEQLVAASERPALRYRVTILNSPSVNAFALPGGYIYITRGLLAMLNSEAELAGVLGHEIGHVTARHGVRQQSAAQAANIGLTIASIFVPEIGSAGGQNIANIVGGALLSGYGRDHELEADRLGAVYLARGGVFLPASLLHAQAGTQVGAEALGDFLGRQPMPDGRALLILHGGTTQPC